MKITTTRTWHLLYYVYPDSKVHGVNMGPIWGRRDPGGPHVGPINFAIWASMITRNNVGHKAWLHLSLLCAYFMNGIQKHITYVNISFQ